MKKEKLDKKLLLKNLKRTWKYMKTVKMKIFLYCFLLIIQITLGIILPLVSAKQILFLSNSLFEELLITSFILLGINIIENVINYFKEIIYIKINNEITNKIQIEFAREFLKLEIKEIDKSSTGAFAERINNDTTTLSYVFFDLTNNLSSILSKVGTLITIFFLNKIIFLYLIIVAIITLIIGEIRNKIQDEHWKKMHQYREEKYSLINELVRGIRDIKVLNAINNVMKKTEESIKKVATENLADRKTTSKFWMIQDFINNISDILFFVLGISLCNKNLMTASTFLILYNYRGDIGYLFSGLSRFTAILRDFNLAATKVFEVIYGENFNKEQFGSKNLKKIKGHIEFKNVYFTYDNKKNVINNLNLEISPNETVGFVGKSGAGKSTIFSLITKLYPATKGSILFDGTNINELTEQSIRGNISIITQNPYIFNFSIKENLMLAKPNATLKEIRKACKLACIDDYFMTLNDQYETTLGEGGLILSGGQKQRLAIARALLANTEIILFDEATSSLDNETQDIIKKAIHNLKGEHTILIIAHRLSTVIDSDKIFVIDKGKVVGAGTHKELINNNKVYQSLYQKENN